MLNTCTPRLARLLVPCLVLTTLGASLPLSLSAQQAAVAQAAPKALFIQVLEGEGELNDIRARTAREPIVEVQDENHKPVAGALVLFTVQSGGQPGATFSGLTSLSVRTGADGRAVGTGYKVTRNTVNFSIAVQATVAGVVATAVIHQTNYAHGSTHGGVRAIASNKPLVAAIVELAAFAAASTTILVETRDPSSTSITAGTGTVTAPSIRVTGNH